eukprot:TRINITY_DN1203_c0_g1_i1.p1 TRINITY_DN1203_c0_g1~~TRINITY_DN1203_c0_g1_i1.p1  ORF type:complete len:290 (+),score=72.86 TRINITY_DN1203_c0_g1_i1:190-1059(+)
MTNGKKTKWEFILTGTGSSQLNPVLGIPEMWSEDPRDHRRRPGAMLRNMEDGRTILIDVGPDLMHQLQNPYKEDYGYSYPTNCITRCDGVFITHDHADHILGMNDLRLLCFLMEKAGKSPCINVHCSNLHVNNILKKFDYCFNSGKNANTGTPNLNLREFEPSSTIIIAGLAFETILGSHGQSGAVIGFRVGPLAYLTDIKVLPDHAYEVLQDVDMVVLDFYNIPPHSNHPTLTECEEMFKKMNAKKAVLTHLSNYVTHKEFEDRLVEGMQLGVDGFTVQLEIEDAESY